MKSITLHDESLTGDILDQIIIQVENERMLVRDLIQARVQQEVAKHNQNKSEYFRGLIQPSEAEQTLNGYKLKKYREIDPEKQTYIAWEAFQNNSFFILIDNRQVESLEEEVLIADDTTVSFVKLTPLVGG